MQAASIDDPNKEDSNPEAVDDGQAIKTKELQTIISHLTTEIESKSTNIMNFRTKIAFTVFIGPFLLLGSIIVGTKGTVKLRLDIAHDWWAVLLVVLAFLALGWISGAVERQVWRRINKWRRCIVRLQTDPEITTEELQEFLIDNTIEGGITNTYVLAFLVILLAFGACAYIAASIVGGSAPALVGG